MKLYLASFLETHNFGPKRVISIANGDKPEHLDNCKQAFPPLTPDHDIMLKYRDAVLKDPVAAGKEFVSSFESQLEQFVEELQETCKKEDKSPQDILPFEDGDTLASWERRDYTNYRKLVAPYLEKLGYEVVLN